jgi:glucose-6-phosphate 1-dehydrogenase
MLSVGAALKVFRKICPPRASSTPAWAITVTSSPHHSNLPPNGPPRDGAGPHDPIKATVVIFGASGDLTARKLVPALFHLWRDGFLADQLAIVGVARRSKTDELFRNELHEAIKQHGRSGPRSDEEWQRFASHVHYRELDLSQPEQYAGFAGQIAQIEQSSGVGDRRIFYMATAPELFVPTVEAIGRAGLVPERRNRQVLRVVFEKPFGNDLASARELGRRLGRMLREEQVYRIDHYLGKETVQNLLLFRFGNAIFEPLFNRTHVDHVQITVAESQGIERGRGAYYDKAGALRDVLQNHVLQLLALVAMEPPSFFRAKEIRDEKVKVLEALAPGDPLHVDGWAARGQYTAGEVGGQAVPGYLEEDRIAPSSRTETFAALDVRIDNWRWAGVPFYLRTGKRLRERVSEVAIQFKLPPLHLFKTVECEGDICALVEARPNTLIFRIQPSESIALSFSAKRPGMQYQIHPVRMDFAYDQAFPQAALPEAYERLLLDVLRGDSTLFMRNDELEAAWRLVTPVLEAWEANPSPPEAYRAGTWGPECSERLLARARHTWRTPTR